MTAKKQAKAKVEWKGYLNVNLTAADDKLFDQWEADRVFGIADVGLLVDAGYKFSLNWDDHHSGYVASLYSGSPKLAWTGYTLTAWSDTPDEAVKLLMFKHFFLCNEDWEQFTYKSERIGGRRG